CARERTSRSITCSPRTSTPNTWPTFPNRTCCPTPRASPCATRRWANSSGSLRTEATGRCSCSSRTDRAQRLHGLFLRRGPCRQGSRRWGAARCLLLLFLFLDEVVLALRDLLHQRAARFPILLVVDRAARISLFEPHERHGEADRLAASIDGEHDEA